MPFGKKRVTSVYFSVFLFSEKCVNVLFIGMPGSGKSSTINIILNEDVCESGQTFKASGVTQDIQYCKMKLHISSAIGNDTCFLSFWMQKSIE